MQVADRWIESMRTTAKHHAALLLGWLLLCRCPAADTSRLPAELRLNEDAGRGNWIVVTVRIANGEKLPFIVDTGAPVTVFDKSLEPLLGQRLDTGRFWNFGVAHEMSVYAAPKLYLGDSRLVSNTNLVASFDCRQYLKDAGEPIRGILGMDILGNYCIQLDFQKETMRFLNARRANKRDWGTPFPLQDIGDGCFGITNNLVGVQGPGSLVDTGTDGDGWLLPELYREWTNEATDGAIHFPNGALGGEIYHGLDLADLMTRPMSSKDIHMKLNTIGIHVLSENLVTLDFPERMLYLKRTSAWPLVDPKIEAATRAEGQSAANFLRTLKENGQLPGWTKTDYGTATAYHVDRSPALDSVTIDVMKTGILSTYHYTVTRPNHGARWILRQAWRTDANGETVEYRIMNNPYRNR